MEFIGTQPTAPVPFGEVGKRPTRFRFVFKWIDNHPRVHWDSRPQQTHEWSDIIVADWHPCLTRAQRRGSHDGLDHHWPLDTVIHLSRSGEPGVICLVCVWIGLIHCSSFIGLTHCSSFIGLVCVRIWSLFACQAILLAVLLLKTDQHAPVPSSTSMHRR